MLLKSNKLKAVVILGTIAAIVVAFVGLPFDSFGLESKDVDAYGTGRITSGSGVVGRLDAWNQVVPLNQPGGDPVSDVVRRANGSVVVLPNDKDGNGYDTYVVMDEALVNGVLWYALFIGSPNQPAWVPASYIRWVSNSEG